MPNVSPIIISGSIAVDRIMRFDGKYTDVIHPDKLDSLSVSMLLTGSHDADGGNGGNIVYSLALLGSEPVLLGSVGPNGLLYMEKLAHHGVDISHVFESELPTASFTVITDSVNNQVAGFYPGAMADSKTLSFEPWKDMDPITLVSAQDPDAMRHFVQECKDWNLRLCYDVSQQVSNLDGADIAAGVDTATILIVNDYEMTVLSKKIGKSIEDIKLQVPIVITTLGGDGSIIEGKDVPEPIKIGVAIPTRVADPTGAGDAYRAGLLHGYARGWPLKKCGQLGAVCATYAVEQMGTQEHQYTFSDIEKRYKDNFGEELGENS